MDCRGCLRQSTSTPSTVAAAADGDVVLVTVRRSKTNQEGETTDVRFVKGGVAGAIRTLRGPPRTLGPADRRRAALAEDGGAPVPGYRPDSCGNTL